MKLAARIERHIPDWRSRFMTGIMMAFLFSAIGWVLPKLVVRYTPAESYYDVQITGVDKKIYKPCETIHYVLSRKSRVSSGGRFRTVLVHLIDDKTNRIQTVARTDVEGAIDPGEQLIQRSMVVPCDAEDGTYFLDRSSIFYVDGIQKVTEYKSEPFQVDRKGGE